MIEKKTKINMSSSGLTQRSSSTPSMSSSGLTRRSRNREEQGRSMVEMLGVLAIVGVLSVGGIAGYTYAMNKHYANELLAGASERAVLVTAQLASGREPNLNEFAHYPNVGGTFGQAKKLEDGSAFIIPVSGVKGAVCENLVKAIDGTDISIANDDTDLSDATCDDENPNDLAFVFKTGLGGNSDKPKDPNTCDPACEDNKLCIGGICVGTKRSCPFFVEYCDEDYETGEKNCTTELSSVCSEFCSEGEEGELICDTSEELNCIYNSDCNDWCQDKGGECFCLLSGYGISSGECALVDDYSSDASEYSHMTWFAANNWCQAQGATVYNLTAEVLENGEFADAGDIIDDVCCAVGDCAMKGAAVNITLNAQPARVKCNIYESPRLKIYEGYGEYTPLCN